MFWGLAWGLTILELPTCPIVTLRRTEGGYPITDTYCRCKMSQSLKAGLPGMTLHSNVSVLTFFNAPHRLIQLPKLGCSTVAVKGSQENHVPSLELWRYHLLKPLSWLLSLSLFYLAHGAMCAMPIHQCKFSEIFSQSATSRFRGVQMKTEF